MPIRTLDQLTFTLADLPRLPRPGRVLLTTPTHFQVTYVINPHMEEHVGDVDVREAHRQWEGLRTAYTRIGFEPTVMEGADGLCDMVFCANQALPYARPDGRRGVVLSRMFAEQRRGEVPHYEAFFAGEGYEVNVLPARLQLSFEGMGDAIWHPGRYLLWGGHGFRTDAEAYDVLEDLLDAPVVALALGDADFYHLDTCFCPLDESSVLIYPGAFDEDGLALIHRLFTRVLEAPEDEARHLFACNAHCPDGRHVIIQQGCVQTNAMLERAGYVPIEVATDEFLKSGGSVFCMKQVFW